MEGEKISTCFFGFSVATSLKKLVFELENHDRLQDRPVVGPFATLFHRSAEPIYLGQAYKYKKDF